MAKQAGTHVYTDDGEWVEVFQTRDGRLVDANGDSVAAVSATTEVYDRTELIDGERCERYIDTATGETVLYDANGEVISDFSGEDAEVLAAAPRYAMYEGELLRVYSAEDGSDLVLDADGNEVSVARFEQGGFATFEAYAELDGRHCVIGIDADGNRQLYTPDGDLIDVVGRGIDWDDVETVALEPFTGRPIAIGDYTFDGGVESRVYLFPNGAQAVLNDNGGYEAVIVPTDAEYPSGQAFFEGTFLTGMDEAELSSSPVDVFSFPDGQTAYLLDGELVLVDAGLETTYPDGPPVDCGEFPDGNLFVFPDGRQMIQADDGSWSIANLPGIDDYDELVERYDPVVELDAGLDSASDSVLADDLDADADADGGGPLDLGLFDDITTLRPLADNGHRPFQPGADDADGADVASGDVPDGEPRFGRLDAPDLDLEPVRPLADAAGGEPDDQLGSDVFGDDVFGDDDVDDLAVIEEAATTFEPDPDPIEPEPFEPDPIQPDPVADVADLDTAADDAFDVLDGG